MIKDMVVKALRDYEFYQAVDQDYDIILNANEHHMDILNEKLQDKMIEAIKDVNINRYPHPNNTKLRKKYADFIGVKYENVIATVGSDEGIRVISDTFLEAGDIAIAAVPTFSMYKEIAVLGKGKFINVESDDETLSVDVDKIIKVSNENNAKVIYICSPNNPSGYVYEREDIIKVIDSTKSIVVIDEAYMDFYGKSNLDLINHSNRVIVLKTMSKAFAGAGLRVGFIISDKETSGYLDASRLPYNLSSTSEALAMVLLDNYDIVKEEMDIILKERERVKKVIEKIDDVRVFPVTTNFITFRTKKADELFFKLEENGISVRKFGRELKDTLRISIGSKSENEKLIKVIKEVI